MHEKLVQKMHLVGFEDAIPQTSIRTERDKEVLLKKGYHIPLTMDEFVEIYDVDPECVWYAPAISCGSYYFNKKTLAICSLHLEFPMIKSFDEIIPYSISLAEKRARKGEFYIKDYDFPSKMRLQYLRMVLESGRKNFDIYSLFSAMYFSSDFGFDVLGTDIIRYAVQKKSKKAIEKTKKQIAGLPKKIILYRGEGSKSTPYEQSFSWTADINCAYMFACRYGDHNARIIKAEANKNDIIEYIKDRNESEIFIDPQTVRVVSEVRLKGIDFIEEETDKLLDVFLEYKGLLQGVRFAQDSVLHGKEHALRVLLLCLIMADCYQLLLQDQAKLALAAVFHDSQRKDDGEDREHGEDGAKYFADMLIGSDSVEFLCKYHSLPDSEGMRAIGNMPYSPERLEEVALMFKIFKDADALDRVRFGLRDLDVNMLRTPLAKELPLVARLIYENLKL